jgi:hypothetical protein
MDRSSGLFVAWPLPYRYHRRLDQATFWTFLLSHVLIYHRNGKISNKITTTPQHGITLLLCIVSKLLIFCLPILLSSIIPSFHHSIPFPNFPLSGTNLCLRIGQKA